MDIDEYILHTLELSYNNTPIYNFFITIFNNNRSSNNLYFKDKTV